MTRLGKILVILIAFVSLAFAGFSIVVYYAGPNWQEMAGQIEGYTFTYTPGENPTWSAVKARGAVNIATDKNLAKVIDAVLADRLKDVNAEVADYTGRIPPLTAELAATSAANTADEPALLAYIKAEQDRLMALNTDLAKLEAAVLAQTSAAQQIENIASSRREDVFCLGGQLAEIRADKYRLGVILRDLAEELEHVNGNVERATERQNKLHADLDAAGYNPPAVPQPVGSPVVQ
jgi:hypothetical protein